MANQTAASNILSPAIHLVYGTQYFPRPDPGSMVNGIKELSDDLKIKEINASWAFQEAQRCLGQVQIGSHLIKVAGISNPLPQEIIDCTIHPSPWGAQIKAAMRQHRSQISLVYTGGHHDPVEKMVALYKTAAAFANEDLLGILNQNAWTAHPPGGFLKSEMIQSYRTEIPFKLWMGYVKFFVNEGNYWLVTKGHHIFDVPDLAYFVHAKENPDEIIQHFINIFYYIYEQDVFVTAGDTLEISKREQFFKFSEVPEGADFLLGPSGSLVIEKINPDDVSGVS